MSHRRVSPTVGPEAHYSDFWRLLELFLCVTTVVTVCTDFTMLIFISTSIMTWIGACQDFARSSKYLLALLQMACKLYFCRFYFFSQIMSKWKQKAIRNIFTPIGGSPRLSLEMCISHAEKLFTALAWVLTIKRDFEALNQSLGRNIMITKRTFCSENENSQKYHE